MSNFFDLFRKKRQEQFQQAVIDGLKEKNVEVVNVADEIETKVDEPKTAQKPVKEKKEKDEAIVWVSLPTRDKLKLLKKEMNVKNLDVVIMELIKLYEKAKGE